MLTGRPGSGNREGRPTPRFYRRPETISVEHLGTSQTCGFLQGWLRSFRSLPSPSWESSFPGAEHLAQVILCVCLWACLSHQSRAWVASPVPSHSVSGPGAQLGCNPFSNLGCQTVSETSPCQVPESAGCSCCLPPLCLLVAHSSPGPAIQIKVSCVPPASPDPITPLPCSLGPLPISSLLYTAHALLASLPGPIYLPHRVCPSSFRGYICCVFGL